MLNVENLTISYGEKRVVEGVSFSLQKGEVLTLLGPNGSGKSSVAKAISGIVAYSGTIAFEGEVLEGVTQKSRAAKIAYIPPKLESFDSNLSVFDYLLMGRFVQKRGLGEYSAKDREIVSDAMAFAGISALADNTVATLSSGQSQLVLIASALVQQSPVIIFDEPTANLDPKNAKVFADLFMRLKRTHYLIVITHDLALAHHLAQRVLFIDAQQAHLYGRAFFESATLSFHYKVAFSEQSAPGVDYRV